MIDNLLGGDDDEDSGDSSADTDMDGGLFDESESDDDLMGGGDDLMGGGDDMAFGDMDDDGGSTSAEMDNRIDELENEVASLSSTVSTVKSENELISESVDDVEENIRKLLEVYEMVTRGVNPFVDESEMGNVFGSEGGGNADNSMGLFGDDETNEAAEGGVDDSIADADADEFFDDDIDDDGATDFDDFDDDIEDEEFADDGFDEFDDGDEFGDEAFDDGDEFGDDLGDGGATDEGSNGEDGGGGKSFEELKAEYDSGEADWDEGEPSAEEELDGAIDESDVTDTDDNLDDAEDTGENEFGEFVNSEEISHDETPAGASSNEKTDRSVASGKPYLETLPSGYVADIVVMDWLEFLVEEAGVDGAARTIAYYEAIEWIDESAANSLQTFLNGFGGETDSDPEPRSSLTVSHHNTSLRFISRIVNPDMELVSSGGALPWEAQHENTTHTSQTNGIRRPNDRLGSATPINSGDESSQRGYEIESDGGRDRAGTAAFNWVGERRE